MVSSALWPIFWHPNFGARTQTRLWGHHFDTIYLHQGNLQRWSFHSFIAKCLFYSYLFKSLKQQTCKNRSMIYYIPHWCFEFSIFADLEYVLPGVAKPLPGGQKNVILMSLTNRQDFPYPTNKPLSGQF